MRKRWGAMGGRLLCVVALAGAGGCGGPRQEEQVIEQVRPVAKTQAAAGTMLAYRRVAGSRANFQIRVQAEPLTMESLDARAVYSELVTEADANSFAAQTVVQVFEATYRGAPTQESYRVAPDGKVTELKTARRPGPVSAAFVEDGRLLYAPLPDASVVPGISWSGTVTLYLPIPGLPIALPPIPVLARFTFTALEKGPRGPLARIDVRADAAPHQLVSATMTGHYLFDVAQGRLESALIAGPVDARKLGIGDPFPVTVTVTTEGVPPLPAPH